MRLAHVVALCALVSGCHDDGDWGGPDAAADLGLPAQVTHVGVKKPVCCIETTRSAWRVLYLASPVPGGSDVRGRNEATKGELHLADAYGADQVLASNVPRGGYQFTADGRFAIFLSPSNDTYALKIAALPSGTLGVVEPNTIIPSGLDGKPLDYQSFFSPSGRYLLVGVAPDHIQYSTDLTVVDVEGGRVVHSLPHGSFNYIEAVTTDDVMVFQNSTASRQLGTASVVGLYALPLGASETTPKLIDTRTVSFGFVGDERHVVYTRYDGSMWEYGLTDQTHVKLADGVVAFSTGTATDGPVVWIGRDFALHVQPLFKPELLATAPGTTDPWTSFTFSPSGQELYFFDRTSAQDDVGDLYRLPLRSAAQPQLIDRRVSQSELAFVEGRIRYVRGIDGRGDVGELVSARPDGTDARSLARGVAVGSIRQANPAPIVEPEPRGNPPRGPLDFAVPVIPSVWAQLIDANRDPSRSDPLFDESQPVVGALGFARGDAPPTVLDPKVHIGGYRFSSDGYVLVYAGGAQLDDNLAAYVGTLRLYQTLVDQDPVVPVLNGVSEIGRLRDRALFVAAPAASPPGVYFIRY